MGQPQVDYRFRRDRLDADGRVTLRYLSRLRHFHVSYRHRGEPVMLLVAGAHVRVIAEDGALLRELTLNPSRDYQRSTAPTLVRHQVRQRSASTRDMTLVGGPGFEPGASRSRITRQFIQTCRFLRFSVRFFKSTRPVRLDLHESSAGLLHEVLQSAGRPNEFQRDQALRSPWDRPAPATRMPRPWEPLPLPEAALSSWVIR